jgi:hypothetical protein
VQRLIDAASDRLTGALADPGQIEGEVVTALHTIRARALAVAAQVDGALPLGWRLTPERAGAPSR